MLKYTLTILLMISSYSNIAHANNNMGFDEICRIYTGAVNSSMKKEQLSEYIFSNVKKRINEKDALDVHDMIFQVTPKERYKIFKQSAELSLKRNWNCPAIKALIQLINILYL